VPGFVSKGKFQHATCRLRQVVVRCSADHRGIEICAATAPPSRCLSGYIFRFAQDASARFQAAKAGGTLSWISGTKRGGKNVHRHITKYRFLYIVPKHILFKNIKNAYLFNISMNQCNLPV